VHLSALSHDRSHRRRNTGGAMLSDELACACRIEDEQIDVDDDFAWKRWRCCVEY